eukprot:TRINITY_DN5998_c0_g1_i6.p1 TRINITY_DN5998_c0_g1~~TRINITY_DN5998_c0_g1_i6.p1  ORF type:complete len:112 (+),score=7.69 TRINITY_DN5998_c0_g1_i6:283-618(+)
MTVTISVIERHAFLSVAFHLRMNQHVVNCFFGNSHVQHCALLFVSVQLFVNDVEVEVCPHHCLKRGIRQAHSLGLVLDARFLVVPPTGRQHSLLCAWSHAASEACVVNELA